MAREELKWQNIDADDLPAAVKTMGMVVVAAFAVIAAGVLVAAITLT